MDDTHGLSSFWCFCGLLAFVRQSSILKLSVHLKYLTHPPPPLIFILIFILPRLPEVHAGVG